MLQLLIIACLIFKASAGHISKYGNTTAVYGRDAHYRCVMDKPEGVRQVTWQRLVGDEPIENLATYSQKFGRQINQPYHGKVIFTESSLSSTSITLKDVEWKDESCYICSFNVYPDGSTREQTCITVRGISKVSKTRLTIKGHEEEDREILFSCSATGKPAPTVDWDFSAGATVSHQPQTTTARNSDRTFTSSRNITLRIPPDWDGHVKCSLNLGMIGESIESFPFNGSRRTTSSDEGETEKAESGLSPAGTALVVLLVIVVSCVVVAVVIRRKRLKGKRRTPDLSNEEGFSLELSNVCPCGRSSLETI